MLKNKWAKIPFDPSNWPFFYGWVIIVCGTLGILMSIPGQTIGVSTFTDSLIEVLNISRDQISLAYMFGTIASATMLIKAGALYDKYGVRPVAGIGSLALGFAVLLLSQIDKIAKFLGILGNTTLVVLMMTVAFTAIRFFGQGVLTLASRTMMMKWFDERRGFATSFSSVFVSFGFSYSPIVIESLIQGYDWSGAWMIMAVILILVFPVFVLLFFRNNPEDSGLKPDGGFVNTNKKATRFPVYRDFTVSEVSKTYIFWVFALFLSMQGLYITGFTFHLVSIFEMVNMTRVEAVAIFLPASFISVFVSLTFGWLSDSIRLKNLLYVKGIAAVVALSGLILLGNYRWAYYMLIGGIGVVSGMFAVISSVVWPRFFGKTHLGAINGLSMSVVVLGSALGPILFSLSESQTGDYRLAAGVCLIMFSVLTVMAIRIKNPQRQFEPKN